MRMVDMKMSLYKISSSPSRLCGDKIEFYIIFPYIALSKQKIFNIKLRGRNPMQTGQLNLLFHTFAE